MDMHIDSKLKIDLKNKLDLPCNFSIPNKKTIEAMRDADNGKSHKVYSIKEIFE